MEAFRQLANEWFSRYPDEAKADLRQRFRSPIDEQHQASFFELYLHELLYRIGYTLRVHPRVVGERTHPDFLAARGEEDYFYVEVTLAGLPSAKERAQGARIAQVYDCINKLDSPNFFLHIKDRGAPETSPEVGKLRRDLERWLQGLDPDRIAALYDAKQHNDIPKYTWRHEGWEVVFEPIPKSAECRGKSDARPIGMFGAECEWLNTHGELRDAVAKKADKYGKLSLPFIVAVNVLSLHCDGTDIMNGLFGQETFIVTERAGGKLESRPGRREPNGLWWGPRGHRNLTVSGVMVVSNLCPWNMHRTTPELYHNPWALTPIGSGVWELPQCVPNTAEERMVHQGGKAAAKVLNIPSPWPLPDPEDIG
ncbi:MAG: hypothetical protein ACRD5G_05150 [Candidatus Acidiferrales bacterium]